MARDRCVTGYFGDDLVEGKGSIKVSIKARILYYFKVINAAFYFGLLLQESALEGYFICYDKKSIGVIMSMAFAEFISTFMFVLVSCASSTATLWWDYYHTPHTQVAMGFAFAYIMALEFGGRISGAHINPCITLAACLLGKKAFIEYPIYVALQFAGSISAYLVLMGMTRDIDKYYIPEKGLKFCAGQIIPDVEGFHAFFAEFWATFFLILICAGVWDSRSRDKIDSLSLKLGFTLLALHLGFGDFTGCLMNPAQSTSVAIIGRSFAKNFLVVYWVAPTLATIIAVIIYRGLFALEYATEMENWGRPA